jgi:hypothetical protein
LLLDGEGLAATVVTDVVIETVVDVTIDGKIAGGTVLDAKNINVVVANTVVVILLYLVELSRLIEFIVVIDWLNSKFDMELVVLIVETAEEAVVTELPAV